MSSRVSRERARQRRRRVAMAQRLGAIVLGLVMMVALMSIFRGCGKVDDPTLSPAATESSTEAISTEELSASSLSYSPEPEEIPTYYGDPDNYVYPFNTMSIDWDGSVYDNGFKLYEIPEEYAREGGCFPEVVQVYLWCLCEQRDIDYYMVVALIERESGYKWDAAGDGGKSVGYMQIGERWHKERMLEEGVEDLLNPYGNIRVGLNFLQYLNKKYLDNSGANCVLMAYNMGESGARSLWKEGIYSTEYSRGVLKRAEEIRQELGN